MDKWVIVIKGHERDDSRVEYDVGKLFDEIITQLRDQGQQIDDVHYTIGLGSSVVT